MKTMHPLVTAEWLAQHLDDVVVIDGSYYLATMGKNANDEFHRAHIPGAVRWDIDAIADTTSDLKHMMPVADVIARAAGERGISTDTPVVIYDQLGMFSAARVWLTFKTIGHENVALLDGGLPCWQEATASGEAAAVEAVTYNAFESHTLTVDKEAVLSALSAADTFILDARAAGRFNATAPEPVAGLLSGHMPGALNIPYDQLLEADGRFKSISSLQAIFTRVGVSGDEKIITSCGSGVTASIVTFALSLLGIESKVYDGSWSEWGRPALELPVV